MEQPSEKHSISSAISLAISRARQQRGWTQEQCILRASMSRSHLAMIETGRKVPNLATICKLADAFGIQPHELVQQIEDALKETEQSAEVAGQ